MKKFYATKTASVLSNLKPYVSRTMLGKIKQNGGVFVDGKDVKMSQIVPIHSEIYIEFPTRKKMPVKPFDFPLEVAYEDDDAIVLEKPHGMPTHTSRANDKTTLENAYCGLLLSRGEDVANFTFHPITRLDSDTSGLVLICKNPVAASAMSEKIKRGEIHKEYIALAKGDITSDFEVEINMGRIADKKPQRWEKPDGKHSKTIFKVKDKINGDTLLYAYPQTGRTHQIRVHLAHSGHAIVGDKLYGSGGIVSMSKGESLPKNVARLMLFMNALEFENINGEKVRVESRTNPFGGCHDV